MGSTTQLGPSALLAGIPAPQAKKSFLDSHASTGPLSRLLEVQTRDHLGAELGVFLS